MQYALHLRSHICLQTYTYHNVLLMGNFNFPKIRWSEGNVILGTTHKEYCEAEFQLDFMKTLFMEQTTLFPARNNNILHLSFTNTLKLIHNVTISLTIFSDHMMELTIYNKKNLLLMYSTQMSPNSYRISTSTRLTRSQLKTDTLCVTLI